MTTSMRVRARPREPLRAKCRVGAGQREREDGQAFSWEGAGLLFLTPVTMLQEGT